jgi:serine protease Do
MPALWSLARSAAALAAALAITVCSAAPAAATLVEPEEPVGSERVAATVHPTLVRVTGTFSARVHNGQGAYANGGRPYTATFTCSGFGVHPDGYIATAGHCVDANDATLRELLVRAAAEEVVAGGSDVPLEEWIDHGRSAWIIEGVAPGAPIGSEIRVTGIPGAPADGMLARVVDDRPTGQGDVGLLKVDTTDLPTLELVAGSGLAVGMPVFAAGYPDSVGERIVPGATPTFLQSTVDGTATDGGRPVYRLDSDLDAGMSGGPAVDESGRVLGIDTARTGGSFVVPVSGFTELLGRNGVRAELGPRDVRYREAVDAYFRGEYTDTVEAIDRLQQEGPIHPRVGNLRSDAQASRELHGDASENRMTQIVVWGSAGVGAIVIVVVGALLMVRRRRSGPAVVTPHPHPPFPGPYGGPVGPPPVWQQGPRPGVPIHPYGPAAHPPQAPPRAPIARPGRPGPAPQAPAYFDGPTRAITVPRSTSPGSNESENRTLAITQPPAAGGATSAVPEGTDPADAAQKDAPENA